MAGWSEGDTVTRKWGDRNGPQPTVSAPTRTPSTSPAGGVPALRGGAGPTQDGANPGKNNEALFTPHPHPGATHTPQRGEQLMRGAGQEGHREGGRHGDSGGLLATLRRQWPCVVWNQTRLGQATACFVQQNRCKGALATFPAPTPPVPYTSTGPPSSPLVFL